MSTFNLIPALFVLAVAFYLIVWVVRAVGTPIFRRIGLQPGYFERAKLKKKQQLLEDADKSIDAEKLSDAIETLAGAFYLDVVQRDASLIPRVGSLHLSLLNKLILVAELQGQKISNLMVLEELLNSRLQLLKAWNEALLTRRITKQKKRKAGEDLPEWAAKEYDRKLDDIGDKLATNRTSIAGQLEHLFGELRAAAKLASSDVTYH